MRRHLATLGIVVLTCFAANAQEISSGLQVDEGTPVFAILDITGPNKGQTLCYV